MNQIDQALYAKLTAASALTSLLSGTTAIYSPLAPEGATPPYVVFNKQSRVPRYTLGGTAFEDALYQVKGIVASTSAALAGSVAAAIDTALNLKTLSISGYRNMITIRESDIDYPEVVAGKSFQHRGALYRIQATPN